MASALPLNVDAEGNTALHRAARDGDLATVTELLAAGSDITVRNRDGHTALWFAAREAHEEVYDTLKKAGAETDDTFIDLMTPEEIRWGGYDEGEEEDGGTKEPSIFLMVGGHGSESVGPFKERDRLPAGYTLVTFTTSGSPLITDLTFINLLTLFEEAKPELLRSIAPMRKEIETYTKLAPGTIRVYEEGDYYPNLNYQPFVDMPNGVRKSGIYKHPIRLDDFLDIGEKTASFRAYNPDISSELLAIYEDSIYPTPVAAEVLMKRVRNNARHFKRALITPIGDIMEQRGPGIYFYAACRSLHAGLKIEEKLEAKYMTNKKKYGPYIRDIPGRYEELLKELELSSDPEDRAKIAAILSQRAHSSEQQVAIRERHEPPPGGARQRRRRTRRRQQKKRRSHRTHAKMDFR